MHILIASNLLIAPSVAQLVRMLIPVSIHFLTSVGTGFETASRVGGGVDRNCHFQCPFFSADIILVGQCVRSLRSLLPLISRPAQPS